VTICSQRLGVEHAVFHAQDLAGRDIDEQGVGTVADPDIAVRRVDQSEVPVDIELAAGLACTINGSRRPASHEAAYGLAAGLAFDPERWVRADPHLKVAGNFGRRGLWRSLGDHAVARLPAVRTQEIYGYDRDYCHIEITIHRRLYSGHEQGLFWSRIAGRSGTELTAIWRQIFKAIEEFDPRPAGGGSGELNYGTTAGIGRCARTEPSSRPRDRTET
jgi:hypothetical protein